MGYLGTKPQIATQLAANVVTTASIADDAITTAKIAAGAVAASDLASTLDLTGKTVTLPAGTGGKLLKATVMYNSNTRTTGTNSTLFGAIAGTNIYYNNAAMMSGSFTKISSTSLVVIHTNWAFRAGLNGHGVHGALLWKDTSTYYPYNEDFHSTSGASLMSRGFVAIFNGLGTGSHTFYFSGTRTDTTAGQWALNPNTEGAGLTIPQGQSSMIAYEIEV